MSFWSDINAFEPLRQNRWYMSFGKRPQDSDAVLDNNTNKYALKECSKPSYKVETTSHVLLNHTFNYPKNLVWNPIKIKMASVVDDKRIPLGSSLYYLLRKSGYIPPHPDEQSAPATSQLSKRDMSFSEIVLTQIDENGDMVENWHLSNSFITNVNYGSLSYSSDEIVDIEFDIIYDYARNSIDTSVLTRNVDRLQAEKDALNQSIGVSSPNLSRSSFVGGGEPAGSGVTTQQNGITIPFPNIPE